MSCGCPDKETDALIIAEIEGRKREKIKNVPLAWFIYEGDLWKLKDKIEQEKIHSMKQVSTGRWEITYKK